MKRTRSIRGQQRRVVESRDVSKEGLREINPKLGSLVLPWAMIAILALGVAIGSSSWSSSESLLDSADWENNSWLESSSSFISRHLVNTETHSHKPVYNEEHPPLFPLSMSDYIGFSLATIGLMIAAGGGIGGGGILVPIYILVLGFSPKHAIPLSNVTVFGGALANTFLNSRKRHPLADRPLVDWDLILVMEPLTIAGALIGAFLNKILPETLLVVMLVLLLSFTAYNSLKKAVKMHKAETRNMRAQGIRSDGTKESELTRITVKGEDDKEGEAEDELLKNAEMQEADSDDDEESPSTAEESAEEKVTPELQLILEEERHAPTFNLLILVSMFIVILVINLLKGGGAFPSPLGIRCGSNGFWMANVTMLGVIIIVSVYVRSYLVQRFKTKQRVGYQYVEGDIQWDGRATIVYPCVCCLAGFFAGMFGVGGGIVKGPLMLAMGVHPAVSSASSACMILFTSFTATTSFIVFGLIVPGYSYIGFGMGFVATIFGQLGLSYLMKKSGRNSYIAFSIGGVVLLSAFLMTIQSLLSIAEGEHHHSGGICGKDD